MKISSLAAYAVTSSRHFLRSCWQRIQNMLNWTTSTFSDSWSRLRNRNKSQLTLIQQEQQRIQAEQEAILERAEKFDRLPAAGHDEIVQHAVNLIGREEDEWRKDPYNAEHQRIVAVRVNAMKELLEGMIGLVNDTMKRREEIILMRQPPQETEELVNG